MSRASLLAATLRSSCRGGSAKRKRDSAQPQEKTAQTASYGPQYRTRLPAIPADRSGQDQAGPEEIHLSGRIDRQEGEGLRQYPHPSNRNAQLSLWPAEYRRRG